MKKNTELEATLNDHIITNDISLVRKLSSKNEELIKKQLAIKEELDFINIKQISVDKKKKEVQEKLITYSKLLNELKYKQNTKNLINPLIDKYKNLILKEVNDLDTVNRVLLKEKNDYLLKEFLLNKTMKIINSTENKNSQKEAKISKIEHVDLFSINIQTNSSIKQLHYDFKFKAYDIKNSSFSSKLISKVSFEYLSFIAKLEDNHEIIEKFAVKTPILAKIEKNAIKNSTHRSYNNVKVDEKVQINNKISDQIRSKIISNIKESKEIEQMPQPLLKPEPPVQLEPILQTVQTSSTIIKNEVIVNPVDKKITPLLIKETKKNKQLSQTEKASVEKWINLTLDRVYNDVIKRKQDKNLEQNLIHKLFSEKHEITNKRSLFKQPSIFKKNIDYNIKEASNSARYTTNEIRKLNSSNSLDKLCIDLVNDIFNTIGRKKEEDKLIIKNQTNVVTQKVASNDKIVNIVNTNAIQENQTIETNEEQDLKDIRLHNVHNSTKDLETNKESPIKRKSIYGGNMISIQEDAGKEKINFNTEAEKPKIKVKKKVIKIIKVKKLIKKSNTMTLQSSILFNNNDDNNEYKDLDSSEDEAKLIKNNNTTELNLLANRLSSVSQLSPTIIPRKNIRSLTSSTSDILKNKNSFNINSSILFNNQSLNCIPEENESPSKLQSCKEIIKTVNDEDKNDHIFHKQVSKNEQEKETTKKTEEVIENKDNLEEEKAIVEFVTQTIYTTNESSNSLKDIEIYKQAANRLKEMALESKRIDNELKQMTNHILN